jgi:serine/threonine-protein kinase RsbW
MTAASQAPELGAGFPMDPSAPELEGSGSPWGRLFPGEACQLSAVRRWVASLLPECPARDDVTCVATELGTNAIRHSASGRGGSFAVEIIRHRQGVRVAVTDGGAPDGPRTIDDPAAEHGRGLQIVRGLSARTGVCGDHRGRMVWADVPWAGTAAAEAASLPDPDEEAIRASMAGLASRFTGTPAWSDHSALQRRTPSGGRSMSFASAQEVARALRRVLSCRCRRALAVGGTSSEDGSTVQAAARKLTHPASEPLQGQRVSGALHAAS